MIIIHIYNNRSQLDCPRPVLDQLRNLLKIRAQNYFFSTLYKQRKWDGYIQYITEAQGLFYTGLLGLVCENLRMLDLEYKIIDHRVKFKPVRLLKSFGDITLRGDQLGVVQSIFTHTLEGIPFIRGILDQATNYGKSVVAASVMGSFSSKRNSLYIVSSKPLFAQALNDLRGFFGKEDVGYISSDYGVKLRNITIGMSQTLGQRISTNSELRGFVTKQDILIVDEYDLIIGRKDCQRILQTANNAYVRLGFTGTALLSKDKNKNRAQLQFTGPVIDRKTNEQLVSMGISTPPRISFIMGNTKIRKGLDWGAEYMRGVIKNKKRNLKIWRWVEKSLKKGQVLVVFKNHAHGYALMDCCPEELSRAYKMAMIHHKLGNRERVFQDFTEGKIDVLLSSMIIKRGINLPTIRTLINAAGGDSQENVLQILGRVLRKHGSKDIVDLIEFYDEGRYLRRHSKHRIIYYKNQNFPVKELYKKSKNY